MKFIKRTTTNIIFIQCFVLLISHSTIPNLIFSTGISCFLGITFALAGISLLSETYLHKDSVFFDLGILFLIIEAFIYRWLVSSKVAALAAYFHLRANTFLLICAGVLGFFAIRALDEMIFRLKSWIGKKTTESKIYKSISFVFLLFIIVLFQLLQMNNTSIYPIFPIISTNVFRLLLNLLVLLFSCIIASLILWSWRKGIILISTIIYIWGIANYYVVEFHGSPLYLSELINLKTAAAVALGYNFDLSLAIVTNTLLFASIVYVCLNSSLFETINLRSKELCICVALVCITCFTGVRSFLNKNTFEESWRDSIRKDGFIMSAIKDVAVRTEVAKMPDGYDAAKLVFDMPKKVSETVYPDIILILNETFCDLDFYSDIRADTNYLDDFYSIDSAIYGYAVVPEIGGGTNNSEFELLTSKSMNLITSAAPFTYLNSDLLNRSVVEYLRQLGYYTTGMHCGGATNYSRNRAYPSIGFDEIYLGPDKFSNINSYGNRSWLDNDNYLDLIDHYEAQESQSPRFMYLLTFQNHGGYEQNDSSLDTAHTTLDLGDLTDDVNEYISSIQLSAEAIKNLTSYFSKVAHPVIVCMVGDHTPPFINKLSANTRMTDLSPGFGKRVVPYVIWANYNLDFEDGYYEYASMIDLVPMLLDIANLPLSGFYQTILNLHKEFPVRVKGKLVMDMNGDFSNYESDNNKYKRITEYYFLEYNSMMPSDEYQKHIFLLQ